MPIFNKSGRLNLLEPLGPLQGLLCLYLHKFHFILCDDILLMRSLSTPVLNTDTVPCGQQFLQACSFYFAAHASLAQLIPLTTAEDSSTNCTIALNLASQTYRIYQNAWPTFSTTKQSRMSVSVHVRHHLVLEVRPRIMISVLYIFL